MVFWFEPKYHKKQITKVFKLTRLAWERLGGPREAWEGLRRLGRTQDAPRSSRRLQEATGGSGGGSRRLQEAPGRLQDATRGSRRLQEALGQL